MHSTVKRLAVLGALSTTLGIAAPVASAGAASTEFVPDVGGSGQVLGGAVTGAVIITTAPTSFINTNNQVSAVGNAILGQVAP
jgi:hypothetical protein